MAANFFLLTSSASANEVDIAHRGLEVPAKRQQTAQLGANDVGIVFHASQFRWRFRAQFPLGESAHLKTSVSGKSAKIESKGQTEIGQKISRRISAS